MHAGSTVIRLCSFGAVCSATGDSCEILSSSWETKCSQRSTDTFGGLKLLLALRKENKTNLLFERAEIDFWTCTKTKDH